jgi:hypothetical protein
VVPGGDLGGDLHALRLDPAAKSSTCSTVSRASSASLIFRPSQRPLEAPLTAQLRLSEAEADATANTSVIQLAKLYW